MVHIKKDGYSVKIGQESISLPKINVYWILRVLFRLLLFVYDIVTLPIYLILQQPWKAWSKINKIRSSANEKLLYQEHQSSGKTELKVWTKRWPESKVSKYEHCSTISQMFREALSDHKDKNMCGHRNMIREIESLTSDGKKIKKKVLDDKYIWTSYTDFDARVNNVMNGLISKGVKYQDKVVIILETRMEWLLIAQSVFRIGSVLCTLYDTLGINGIIHAINELESSHVVCNQSMASTLIDIRDKIPLVQCLIVVGSNNQRVTTERSSKRKISSTLSCKSKLSEPSKKLDPSNLDIVNLDQLERLPSTETKIREPLPADLALIMYTSGTTGTPKGVMFNQSQFVHMYKGWDNLFDHWDIGEDPVHIAFLPLAHIFEFMMEVICVMRGIPFGYSSPSTIFDHSPGLEKGIKGDISVLQPTVLTAVPLILERMRAQIKSSTGNFVYSNVIFPSLVDHKSFWKRMGFNSPLISKFISEGNNKTILGGRVKTILTGSAPVSQELINFIQSTVDADVILSYATTESLGIGCSMDRFGSSSFDSSAGPPMAGGKIALIEWKDGNYSPKDTPNPRGELLIGCKSVSIGYFKKEAETEEAFFTVMDGSRSDRGTRWLRTGDIAEIDSKYGVVRIIDRKKDLVKLSNGQFVSLTKIELCLKRNRFVENICIAVDTRCNFLVAIIVPNRDYFMNLVHNSVINDDDDGLTDSGKPAMITDELKVPNVGDVKLIKFSQSVCDDVIIKQLIMESIRETAVEGGLNWIEIPVDCHITADEWTPNNGLVTASLKLRRKQVTDHYKVTIDQMYCNNRGRNVGSRRRR